MKDRSYKVQFPDYFYTLDTFKTTLAKAKKFAREYLEVTRLPKGVTFYK